MYAKLVCRNAARSAKDYLIYLLTMTICVALFYAFLSISSRYYQPDIGQEYDFTLLSDSMKAAICAVTLCLLFLIRFVNRYMLRRRQKAFAIQAIMGMEQRVIGWLFFAETFLMGIISIFLGIALGVLCSQFITAMLLTTYGKQYELSWTLFPDTVLLTVAFFILCFLVVGMFNTRTIRRTKLIDMLAADRQNEPDLRKSRWTAVVTILFVLSAAWMLVTGVQKVCGYYDSRFALPVKALFWGNILFPAVTLLWPLIWLLRRHRKDGSKLLRGLLLCSVLDAIAAASVPALMGPYKLTLGAGVVNQYMLFLVIDLLFFLCALIYLISSLLMWWKESNPKHRYKGERLFFFGQILSKLHTTSKTMALTSATLVLAMVLFLAAPILVGWASGYLDVRALYDVQIFTRYNNVSEEKNLPKDNYAMVTEYLASHNIKIAYDCTFSLYLPEKTDFYSRYKSDFPIVAISLSDYNTIREMLGYPPIALADHEFTTQWQSIATEEERNHFLEMHTSLITDAGPLSLAEVPAHTETIGETVYNSYTNVLYIFPDAVCKTLLPVMRNRYLITAEHMSYEHASALEKSFAVAYPNPSDTGVEYAIRLRTLQLSDTKASMFVLQAAMLYGAVVLMVICLTVLSLQQLLDAGQYRYRFSVLRKLGVEERRVRALVLQQLGVWFGLPVGTAILATTAVILYFMKTVSAEISAYIGFGTLTAQIGATGGILLLLLLSYFLCTWMLFQRSIEEGTHTNP